MSGLMFLLLCVPTVALFAAWYIGKIGTAGISRFIVYMLHCMAWINLLFMVIISVPYLDSISSLKTGISILLAGVTLWSVLTGFAVVVSYFQNPNKI